MPAPSPFHERIVPLCHSHRFKDWAGFVAPARYDVNHIYEYTAFRRSAGVIDVTPLYKYDITGPDAGAFLSRVCTKDVQKLKPGRVTYTCWVDPAGKMIDDGTVSRLDEHTFRLTAAEPTYWWLARCARGFDVHIEDTTRTLCALAVQGPCARDVLAACSDAPLDTLRFFRLAHAKLDGIDVVISRTGYTGDLGYEVWAAADDAVRLWDAVMAAGRNYDIRPCGLDALDMVRIEAGFIMLDVDYFSAPHCLIERRKSTPSEIGLDFALELDRAPFIGQAALKAERERGPAWQTVGVELSWTALEALYASYGLPPSLPPEACRDAVPLYFEDVQVGQVTSTTWSPLLKKMIALAQVQTPYAARGTVLDIEHTVIYERRTVPCTVVDKPFYDPPHKRSLPKTQSS